MVTAALRPKGLDSDAKLMLRVFLTYPLDAIGFLGSTGVDAKLWLRVFLGAGDVGVVAAITLLGFPRSRRSAPQNLSFFICAKLMLRDFTGVSDFLCSTGGVRTVRPVGVLGVLKLGADCFLRVTGCRPSTESVRSGSVKLDLLVGLGVEVRGLDFPLLLCEAGALSPRGDAFPLMEEAGETVRGVVESSWSSEGELFVGDKLLLMVRE